MASDHTDQINALIPKAVAEADKQIATHKVKVMRTVGRDGVLFNYDGWTEIFHREVNRLTFQAGLRSRAPQRTCLKES